MVANKLNFSSDTEKDETIETLLQTPPVEDLPPEIPPEVPPEEPPVVTERVLTAEETAKASVPCDWHIQEGGKGIRATHAGLQLVFEGTIKAFVKKYLRK